MMEGMLTKLSPAPSYQNLGQRARPSAEVLQNSGMDTTPLRDKRTKGQVKITRYFKIVQIIV